MIQKRWRLSDFSLVTSTKADVVLSVLFVCLFGSVCLSVCLFVCLSVCLSVYRITAKVIS